MNLRMSSHNDLKKNTKISPFELGFTLIEVMVAMLILTGAIVTLTTSWSGNYFRLNKSQLNHNVAELLQRKMTEIEIIHKDKSFEEVKEEMSGTFEGYPNYRWTMSSQEFEIPDLGPILASQDDNVDETIGTILKQMSEHIKKSVKEIKVSVFVKHKKKEIEFSATTYHIDYNKELDLGALGGLASALGGGGGGGGDDSDGGGDSGDAN